MTRNALKAKYQLRCVAPSAACDVGRRLRGAPNFLHQVENFIALSTSQCTDDDATSSVPQVTRTSKARSGPLRSTAMIVEDRSTTLPPELAARQVAESPKRGKRDRRPCRGALSKGASGLWSVFTACSMVACAGHDAREEWARQAPRHDAVQWLVCHLTPGIWGTAALAGPDRPPR
jgi:hypothetical protein